MGRATTKEELLAAATTNYKKMWGLIDSMTEDDRRAEFTYDKETAGKEEHWKRDNNLRDVLTHLYEWHQLLLGWVNANMKGEDKPFLPPPYNWKTYAGMNYGFFDKHQNTSYEDAVSMVQASHEDVMQLIERFSNEELFMKKQFSWTGTTTLGSYCVSATASHYDWAMKKIKKHIKTL